MENIKELELIDLPIKELSVSFQNLIGLKYLLLQCRIVQLQSSIAMMPELSSLKVKHCKGLQWVKSEEGEEKVGSIISSNVDEFRAECCYLYDDFFSTCFTQLAHVKTLCLRGNNFTFLPECIKEFQFLTSLDVSCCEYLQEIRGVPPNLNIFEAINCISLSSSSSRMLLNQELHEARGTKFLFPGATIPKWFDHHNRGPSTSFWFRNKFPDNVICLLITPVLCFGLLYCPIPAVFINGKPEYFGYVANDTKVKMVELDYTCLIDVSHEVYEGDDLPEVALGKEWNHVEVTYAGLIESSVVKATGIHVFRQEGNMDDIRFDDPYGKRKLDHDLNNSESQPLVKKHRLFRRLWRWDGPERIKKILWNAAHGALMTNAKRRHRHISMDSSCQRCHVLEETCLHALRDCPEVAAFWEMLLPKQLALKMFFNIGDVTVWLERNLSISEEPLVAWPTIFGFAVEVLWKSRNHLLFYRKASSPSDILDRVRCHYEDFIRADASHNLMRNYFKQYRDLFKWRSSPIDRWLKLNVSGDIDPSSGTAACGGIFRDYWGEFVLGFSVKLGKCSIDEAEIWGVYHGIQIARQYDIWGIHHDIRQKEMEMRYYYLELYDIARLYDIPRRHDFGKIVVESAWPKAISFVLDGCHTSEQHCFPLCHELQALTSPTNDLYWSLIHRKGNMAAASFARFGLSMRQPAWMFFACPSFCEPLIMNKSPWSF